MWLIGVAKEDITIMGQLLGIKLVASEFVGYTQLVDLKSINNNVHFSYQKSVIMATYMLCGFANFASIGIQIGGIGIIAPKRKKMLTELGLKAMIAGTIVSLISASIAGIVIVLPTLISLSFNAGFKNDANSLIIIGILETIPTNAAM